MAAHTTTHPPQATTSDPRDAAEDIRVALHRVSSAAPEEFFNIANDLRALGCDEAAVPFYEKAIAAGVAEATYNLALLHHERGRTELARAGFVAASEAGDAKGAFMAAQIFEACSDDERAALHYARALELPETPVRLARVLRRIGLTTEAEDIVAESAQTSWESAVEHALRDTTSVADGLRLLDGHWSRGETRVAVTLALLLEEDGREDDAEAVLLVAAEAGDVQALTNLGTHWRDHGDLEAARRAWGESAERGDALARTLLEQNPL
ncbi:tetratricopeptide repeat protein [Sanguibacter sp. A247]|uniref:tetratricopeptide repeat protein n=1 Tax=unclassified Sanguibacter TaxID=2645534 RepID=UPI003FD70BED